MLALVSLVASVKLDMPISGPLVLEWSITIIACIDGVGVVIATMVAQLFVHQRGRRAC